MTEKVKLIIGQSLDTQLTTVVETIGSSHEDAASRAALVPLPRLTLLSTSTNTDINTDTNTVARRTAAPNLPPLNDNAGRLKTEGFENEPHTLPEASRTKHLHRFQVLAE